ncbi:energy transducer TonB [Alteromonas sp. AMM-1]|uniref:energy transducer TonB n=1 Tax=Alteromonas sp. AMM-1 TaxID=3394233 RepID=UPI0039A47643
MKRTLASFVVAAVLCGAAQAQETPTSFSQAYNQYQEAYQNGTLQDVIFYAEHAYNLGVQQFGKKHENTAALAYNLANAYRDARQFDKALDAYDNVIGLREDLYGKYDLATLEARLDQYYTYSDQASAERSLSLVEKNTGRLHTIMYSAEDVAEANPDDAATAYYLIGTAMAHSGHMPESARKAKSILSEGIAKATATWGELDIRTLELQYILALIYKGDYKLPEAASQLEALAAKISKNAYESHPWALQAHAVLVELYTTMDQHEKATKHCQIIGQVRPWKDNVEPEPIFRKRANYPRTLGQANIPGEVVLKYDIDPEGYAVNMDVVSVEGGDEFAKSALVALTYWRFAPKYENGQPVTALNNYSKFTFSIYN